ncbi:hypothetical protein CPB85DRAFT_1226437 [Mucidula mucida]|nr:hypothetical protein CPB85DRAFT_1226437 [Mucidula mucida]
MQFEDPSEGVAARLEAGTAPVAGLEGLMNDPAKMQAILAMLKHDAEERERTGETVEQQMLREKMEWAAADARSAEIKLEANEAFRKGDYKEAFVLYSLCCQQSGHEPLYPLNRAAAGLKLNLYRQVIRDASHSIKRNFNLPKAFYRRAQAHRFLGDFDSAEADITQALFIEEDDPTLVKEMEELQRLQDLDTDEQEAWISKQQSKTVDEVFGTGEFERLIDVRLARQD